MELIDQLEQIVERIDNIPGDIDEMDLALLAFLFLFDDEENEEQEEFVWTKITVNLDEYRYMADVSFRLHFRMSRVVFEELALQVGPHLRSNKSVGHILMMSLWILATPDSFRSVALRFGVSPGVLHYIYRKVLQVLCDLAPSYVQWPTARERTEIEERFRIACHLPGVVGAVDGTHIYTIRPGENPTRLVNRFGTFSIALQGVCDDTLLFRDIYVGESGKQHDSRVFRRSPLSALLLEDANNTYLSPDQYILGDGAYILTDQVLKPFRNDGNLSDVQRWFNVCLASGRVVIEQAFGLLKGKWRRLKYLHVHSEEDIVNHVVACVMLHNFLLCQGEPIDEGLINNIHPRVEQQVQDPLDPEEEHINVDIEPDHPLLHAAMARGVELRHHMAQLVFNEN
ncbi:protein ANTAGONIST OF LIKE HETEROCHROMATIN PROTEIN 1-like [Thrips palmi]|uniref:Protein ANTAGONIST OF LIKE HETEROCHROMATIN PROTEIN 1-like n=1 Tax=Thrips palmi TaxID=161013 RepID=A0A6P8XWS5_THRPL|nr:protein ANTAGONIST OF LIKE HETEROCHROMATIN PROTEIN 1-like [Thrips palmi]